MMDDITIRNIEARDNAAVAAIIRGALEEFGAARPGTVYFDKETDHLFELFANTPGGFYTVAEKDGVVLGGAGIFPTDGLPDGTCELVKMYLARSARGLGLGRMLIDRCISRALEMGYTQIYLETMPELKKAVSVYEKFGFQYLDAPLGNSGHTGCGIWMLLELAGSR